MYMYDLLSFRMEQRRGRILRRADRIMMMAAEVNRAKDENSNPTAVRRSGRKRVVSRRLFECLMNTSTPQKSQKVLISEYFHIADFYFG